ncbi:MAG: GtrA family protein [Pseudomonadota bacterium]
MISLVKSLLGHELFRYLFYGGFNALIAYLVYALGIYLGLNYVGASFVSFVVSVYTGYLMYGNLVFKTKANFKFILAWYYGFYVSLFFLAILLHYVFNRAGFNNDYVNGFVIQGINIVIAFFTNRFVFFRKQKS